ncbi:MAG TPA: Calx-beta domain-containing protein, partial [Pyrinomonadaceae bacterium]|nr:Calx-beta domain-containing protein [Pyrinomonadaceae bacterium]
GTGSVNVTAGDSCEWGLAEGADWVDTSGPSASGSGAASYTVRANADTGPRQASIDIAGQKLTVRQAASSACGSKPIAFGQTVEGRLTAPNPDVKPAVAGDCRSGQPERPNAFIDLYSFSARAGQSVRIEMSGSSPDASTPPVADTFLYLFGPDGSVVAFNDDVVSGAQTNSRIPLSGFLQLPQTGVYTIEATSFANGVTGGYRLTLSDNAVEFASAAPSVSETPGAGGLGTDGSGFRVVNVTRSGDTSHAATVDYATSDGTAERRMDYEQALGTLAFAPGETSKSFTVFVVDDAFAEGPETVGLTLSNPSGTTLGPAREATLTIDSDDAASASSPARAESFDTAFFVRQQYLDFLGREPDPSGFTFWQGEITGCGSDAHCAEVKRVNVSAAFFLSIEFQNTGFLVYKTYGAAFGTRRVGSTVPLTLEQFLPNLRRVRHDVVVGSAGWEAQLEANKAAYFDDFVSRPVFVARYPSSMTAAQFVGALDANAGALSAPERDRLVADLESGAKTRAQVLRAVAEDPSFSAAQLDRAFVLMEYFAYLRRDPNESPDADFSGYNFWLSKLEQFGGDYVRAEMVKAFITSDEYVRRFGL